MVALDSADVLLDPWIDFTPTLYHAFAILGLDLVFGGGLPVLCLTTVDGRLVAMLVF